MASISERTFIDPRSGDVLVRTLGEAWLLDQQSILKPSTFHSIDSSWRVHVEPRWGKVKVADVRHSDIRAWVGQLATERSATTVLRAHGVLSGVLDVAARDRRIAAKPCARCADAATSQEAARIPVPRSGRISRPAVPVPGDDLLPHLHRRALG